MTTVLIVDDHPAFRTHARALLHADGFTVIGEAGDGATGLEAVGALGPDLVLLDIGLPDIDGFAVAHELSRAGPQPLVILVSSREAVDIGPRLGSSAVLGFIAKDELSGAAIRALLGRP